MSGSGILSALSLHRIITEFQTFFVTLHSSVTFTSQPFKRYFIFDDKSIYRDNIRWFNFGRGDTFLREWIYLDRPTVLPSR